MANSDGHDPRPARGGGDVPPDNQPSGGQVECGAGNLEGVLRRLADQLSDADRRHSVALDDMRTRLGQLGERADAVKSRAPAECSAAFDRLEDRLTDLADRLQVSRKLRDDGREATGEAAPVAFPAPATVSVEAQAGSMIPAKAPAPPAGAAAVPTPVLPPVKPAEAAAAAVKPARPQSETPVFRGTPARRGEASTAALQAAMLTAGPGTAKPTSTEPVKQKSGLDPWDKDEAEALAKAYAQINGEPEPVPSEPKAAESKAVAPAGAPIDVAKVASEAAREAAERAGMALESRLADLAPRVAQNLAQSMPKTPPTDVGKLASEAAQQAAERVSKSDRQWLESRLEDLAPRMAQNLAQTMPKPPATDVSKLAAEAAQEAAERVSKADREWLESRLEDLAPKMAHNLAESLPKAPVTDVAKLVSDAVREEAERASRSEREWLESRLEDLAPKMAQNLAQCMPKAPAADIARLAKLASEAAGEAAERVAKAERKWLQERLEDLGPRMARSLAEAMPKAPSTDAVQLAAEAARATAERVSKAEREWLEGRLEEMSARMAENLVQSLPKGQSPDVGKFSKIAAEAAREAAERVSKAEREWLEGRLDDLAPRLAQDVALSIAKTPDIDVAQLAAEAAREAAGAAVRAERDWLEERFAALALREPATPSLDLSKVAAETAQATQEAVLRSVSADREWLESRLDELKPRAGDSAIEIGRLAGESVRVAMQKVTQGERDWLEKRFAEIASRLETAPLAAAPDASFDALSQRFDALELKLNDALTQIATNGAAPAELTTLESHIGEIADHIGLIEQQIARIDAIESELGKISASLLEAQTARAETAMPSEEALGTIAAAAAESAISRLAGEAQGGVLEGIADAAVEQAVARLEAGAGGNTKEIAQRIDQLQGLIEASLTESREGEGHTANILEAMQQSLSVLADRLERMEASQAARPMPAQAMAMAPQAGYEPQPYMEPRQQPARMAPPPMPQPMLPPGMQPEQHLMAAEPSTSGPELFDPSRMRRPGQGPVGEAGPSPHMASGGREDFIAAARRAARQAASQPGEPPPSAGKPTAPVMMEPEVAEPKKKGLFSAERLGLKGGAKPVLLVAVAALLIASGSMLYGKLMGRTDTARLETPAVASQKGPGGETLSRAKGQGAASSGQIKAKDAAKAGKGDEDEDDEDENTDAPAVRPGQNKPRASNEGATELAGNDRVTTASIPLERVMQEPAAEPAPSGPSPRERQRVMQIAAEAAGTPITTGALADKPAAAAAAEAQSIVNEASATSELPPAAAGPLSLRIAAQKGDPAAEFEIASRYAQGNGLPRDFDRAAQWYARSAGKGFAPAQYRLGTLFERGLGLPADPGKARFWYRKAADAGNLKAMHNLAVLHAQREADSPDYPTAAHWFSEAAERGLSDSQFNLAILYENGLGVTRSLAQAYKWFSLAAASGDKEAVRRRDQVHRRMEPADRTVAEDLVRNWRSTPANAAANDARLAGEALKQKQAAVAAPATAASPAGAAATAAPGAAPSPFKNKVVRAPQPTVIPVLQSR